MNSQASGIKINSDPNYKIFTSEEDSMKRNPGTRNDGESKGEESATTAGYIFTLNLFDPLQPQWQELISWSNSVPGPIHILEIGSYEGRASIWMLENLIHHPDSTLTVIDSFDDQLQLGLYGKIVWDGMESMTVVEARFRSNILKSGKESQVKVLKGKSVDMLRSESILKTQFDFVYVDGSHDADDTLADAVLVWPLVKSGQGRVIFDDYTLNFFKEPYNCPKTAIDSFIACYQPEIEILSVNYQMTIRKKGKKEEEGSARVWTLNPDFFHYYNSVNGVGEKFPLASK